jgi:hypothetical protein
MEVSSYGSLSVTKTLKVLIAHSSRMLQHLTSRGIGSLVEVAMGGFVTKSGYIVKVPLSSEN